MDIHHQSKVRWTDEEKALFNGAYTLIEISRMTGRTYASVNSFYRKKRKKFKLKLNEDTLKKEVAKLTKRGLSRSEVVKITGASPNYVSLIRAQHLNARNYRLYTDEDKQFIIENYSTMKIKELAEKFGRTVGSVSNQIMRLKDAGLIQAESRKKGYKLDYAEPRVHKKTIEKAIVVSERKKLKEEKREKCFEFIIKNKDEKNLFIEFTLGISPSTLRKYKNYLKEAGRL